MPDGLADRLIRAAAPLPATLAKSRLHTLSQLFAMMRPKTTLIAPFLYPVEPQLPPKKADAEKPEIEPAKRVVNARSSRSKKTVKPPK